MTWEGGGTAASSINSFDAGDEIFLIWGVNTMPADALTRKVVRESTGMVLAV